MSGFTLRQFEIFVQVVEHGSFRRCAEQLGVSQASISEHMLELESRLGVKLFDRRTGGPSTLTPEGVRAHQRIAAILADIDDLILDVGKVQTQSRRLAVGMHPYLMRYLQDTLAEFRKLHPDVTLTLDLDVVPPAASLERIQSRELDVAYFFAFDGREIADSQLVRLEPLAIFVGREHPLAHKNVVTTADIRATPSIHLTTRNPLRSLVDRALAQAGAGDSPIGLDTDEYGLILSSVHQNRGFCCMFQSVASEVAQASALVSLPLEHPLPALQVRRMTRHSARHDALTNELIERLTKTLAKA